jgi:molecular chaperone GrpE (heat shock protein)
MSHLAVLKALSQLAERIDHLQVQMGNGRNLPTDSSDLSGQLKKLAREQYKANTLAEQQATRQQTALDLLQEHLAAQATQQAEAERRARLDLVNALLPVLDGIERGIESGVKQVKLLHHASPTAAQVLVGWLQGQRLLRERLLTLLAAEGVTPLPSIGHPFDPEYQVAISTTSRPDRPDGDVIAEEQRGYRAGDAILRYAHVIVNKHTEV